MTVEVIERSVNEVQKRRDELNGTLAPQLAELHELEEFLARVEGKASPDGGTSPTPRRRRQRSGNRKEQVLTIVSENPGLRTAEIAKKMGDIAPNYLYRIVPNLVEEGKLRKDGKQYFPAEEKPAEEPANA